MNAKNLDKLVTESLAIEARDAKEAGTLGFMARALVQATMPHKNPGDVEAWGRENGGFSMVMQPGIIKKGEEIKRIGLPYGTYPRLLLAWLNTEAVLKKERTLVLGNSLSEFMRQLGITPAGGRWGTISRLKEQMHRLFSSSITCTYEEKLKNNLQHRLGRKIDVASAYEFWWTPKNPDQPNLWQSTVTLGEEFFKEIITNPIPIDARALRVLKGSSMRIDIYVWLTYRMSYLKRQISIPWPVLEMQFGSDFNRTIDFKVKFKEHLKKVLVVYPEAKIDITSTHLILNPSRPHVPYISA